jgi:hypothetical protein
MNDSQVAQRLMSLCVKRLGVHKICVDQGFKRSGNMLGYFVGLISKRRFQKLHPEVRRRLARQSNKYVRLRQAVEWGMRALQGTYSRLTSLLTHDHVSRQLLLEGIFLMHNFRTKIVGFNQIKTVFGAAYVPLIHVTGQYDRIKRYFERA